MGVTGSNSGVFSTPGFVVSPVEKRERGEERKKKKGRREKGNRKGGKEGRRKEGIKKDMSKSMFHKSLFKIEKIAKMAVFAGALSTA